MISKDVLLNVIKRLDKGQAVLSHRRHQGPIPVVVPKIELPTVSDIECDAYMAPFWKQFPPVIVEEGGEAVSDLKGDALSVEKREFLMEIHSHPGRSTTELYKALQWASSKGNRVKDALVRDSLVKAHKIVLGRRGGNPDAIELLPAAYEKLGMAQPKLPVKGGFEHRWWCYRIASKFQDSKPELEKTISGKAVDVAVQREDGWVAYEVQLSEKTSLLKDLVEKDLKAGFVEIHVCVPSPKILASFTVFVEENFSDDENLRLRIELLSDYF